MVSVHSEPVSSPFALMLAAQLAQGLQAVVPPPYRVTADRGSVTVTIVNKLTRTYFAHGSLRYRWER